MELDERVTVYNRQQHKAVMAHAAAYWASRKAREARRRARAGKASDHTKEEQTAGKSLARGSQGYMDFQGG